MYVHRMFLCVDVYLWSLLAFDGEEYQDPLVLGHEEL